MPSQTKYLPLLLAPSVVAELVPGRKVSIQSVYKWMHGVRGKRLRTKLIAGRRYFTREWLEAFLLGDEADEFAQAEPAAKGASCTK